MTQLVLYFSEFHRVYQNPNVRISKKENVSVCVNASKIFSRRHQDIMYLNYPFFLLPRDKKTKFVDIKEEKITPAEEPPQPPRKPAGLLSLFCATYTICWLIHFKNLRSCIGEVWKNCCKVPSSNYFRCTASGQSFFFCFVTFDFSNPGEIWRSR